MAQWTLYKGAVEIKTVAAEYLFEAIQCCDGVFTSPVLWSDRTGCHQWFVEDDRSYAYELVRNA